MDSYWNFKNVGNDLFQQGDAAPFGSLMSREGSVHSSTVDQSQNSLGRYYGSMIDELLHNISNAEETQGVGLQRKYMAGEQEVHIPQIQKQQNLRDFTLDEFIAHVGVKGNTNNHDDGCFRDQPSSLSANPNINPAVGFKQEPMQYLQGSNMHPNLYQPHQPIMSKPNGYGYGYGSQIGFPSGQVNTHGKRGSLLEIGDQNIQGSDISMVPRVTPFHGLRKNNGDISLVSSSPFIFSGGNSVRGRRSNNVFALENKDRDKKQRRKIKNREAAARSRAKQLAQVMELEAEVEMLKKENQELRRKQEEMSKMQPKSVEGMTNLRERPERRLRRTQSDIK